MYEEFYEKILLARENASQFHRVDLHVHSPDSHDYPSVHDKPGFVAEIPDEEKALARVKTKDLDLIAVTDHNEADYSEFLSAQTGDDFVVLPGIEISVQTSLFPDSTIHVLGIFPRGTSAKEIDKVFPAGCGMPPSGSRAKNDVSKIQLKELISIIKNLNGICIAAHVSSNKGARVMVHEQNVDWLQKNYLRRYLKSLDVSTLTRRETNLLAEIERDLKPLDDSTQNTYLEFLSQQEFDAIQIQAADHEQHYRGSHVEVLGLRPFPCILCSDAHSIADIGCVGHASHIKMSNLSLEGIKKALLDPGTRIRFDSNVPKEKPARILGIAFSGGSFDEQSIGFSDNLTTLIGGRGTGKSALIEAVRYVFGYSVESLPERLRIDIEDRLNFTLGESEVKLLYSTGDDDNPIVIKRRFGDSKPSCYSLAGELIPEIDPLSSQLVRAEVFGWSEIEELSDSPEKQLSLLDRTIEGVGELMIAIQESLEALRSDSNTICALCRDISILLPHIENSDEVRRQLAELQEPALDQAFSSFDKNEAASSAIQSLEKQISDELVDWLSPSGETKDLIDTFDAYWADALEATKQYEWSSAFIAAQKETIESIQAHYDKIMKMVASLEEGIEGKNTELTEERKTIEEDLNKKAEESGQADFKTALSRRQELSQQLSTFESYEKDIADKLEQIKELFSARKARLLPALVEVRRNLFRVREIKAGEITSQLEQLQAASGVSISIEELGNRTLFKNSLGMKGRSGNEGLLKHINSQYMSKDYPGFYSTKFTPQEFVEAILQDFSRASELDIKYIRSCRDSSIVRIVEGSVTIDDGTITELDENGHELFLCNEDEFEYENLNRGEDVWKHLSPHYYDNEIQEYPDHQKMQALLELETLSIDDLPMISLDEKQIGNLSPGQRCSAIIPIILAEGDTPLIIDQPEDNLDNKLVFELVVDILRALKEKRQIIVATHNPNIPVSGDAEQVVVFESPDKHKCNVAKQASIDDPEIVMNIKAIMEGGDEAFEMRMIKYGIRPR